MEIFEELFSKYNLLKKWQLERLRFVIYDLIRLNFELTSMFFVKYTFPLLICSFFSDEIIFVSICFFIGFLKLIYTPSAFLTVVSVSKSMKKTYRRYGIGFNRFLKNTEICEIFVNPFYTYKWLSLLKLGCSSVF